MTGSIGSTGTDDVAPAAGAWCGDRDERQQPQIRARHRPTPAEWDAVVSELVADSAETGMPKPADLEAAATRLRVSARTVHDRFMEAVRSIKTARLDEASQQAVAAASSSAEAVERLRRLGHEEHAAALISGIARTPARHATRRWSAQASSARPPPGPA